MRFLQAFPATPHKSPCRSLTSLTSRACVIRGAGHNLFAPRKKQEVDFKNRGIAVEDAISADDILSNVTEEEGTSIY